MSLSDSGFILRCDVEILALAAGVVERRGGISYSAASLRALRRSLEGQADYVRRVHPTLVDGKGPEMMRKAGAREYIDQRRK
ncbi:hypothetical protein ACFO3J_17875 [Streptomyces polygonati]|uniref:Uncharacterized protein n=1 Tax=Streptomyces polygonati TaxID=1617087 RepID=A0ABV8HST2_9ACTN